MLKDPYTTASRGCDLTRNPEEREVKKPGSVHTMQSPTCIGICGDILNVRFVGSPAFGAVPNRIAAESKKDPIASTLAKSVQGTGPATAFVEILKPTEFALTPAFGRENPLIFTVTFPFADTLPIIVRARYPMDAL